MPVVQRPVLLDANDDLESRESALQDLSSVGAASENYDHAEELAHTITNPKPALPGFQEWAVSRSVG